MILPQNEGVDHFSRTDEYIRPGQGNHYHTRPDAPPGGPAGARPPVGERTDSDSAASCPAVLWRRAGFLASACLMTVSSRAGRAGLLFLGGGGGSCRWW